MFEAELAHKLPELRHREDYLTSCIFGSLKYIPPAHGILEILGHAVNYRSGKDFASYIRSKGLTSSSMSMAELHFWPKSKAYGEPDLILVSKGDHGSFLTAIEVKYFSSKHGEGEEDQLVRYYLALQGVEGRRTFSLPSMKGFTGDFLGLVYITQYEAELEIEQTLGILKSKGVVGAENKFFHLRWPDIAKEVQSMLARASGQYEKAIYRDIGRLLEARNLMPFYRFSALPTSLLPESLLETPVFFDPEDRKSRRFTGFPPLPAKVLPRALEARPVFIMIGHEKTRASFKGFSRVPRRLRLSYHGNIYYGGPQ